MKEYILLILLSILLYSVILQNTESYKTAIEYIQNDENIKKIPGGIEKYSLFTIGKYKFRSNGYAESKLLFIAYTQYGKIYTEVDLIKQPTEDWNVKDIFYRSREIK